jgi:hypothetical protein
MITEILGKHLFLVGDATLEDYEKLVSTGTNRTAAQSLTDLVLAAEEDIPILYMEQDTALLLVKSDNKIKITSAHGNNPALAITQLCRETPKQEVTIRGASENLVARIRGYHARFFKTEALRSLDNDSNHILRDKESATEAIDMLAREQEICKATYWLNRHLHHNLETYDTSLDAPEYAKLRNAVNRSQREGVVVQKMQLDQKGVFNLLLNMWKQHKFYKLLKAWNESKEKRLEERKKIAEQAGEEFTDTWKPVEWPATIVKYLHTPGNPIEIYTASAPGKGVVAAIGVGVFGESAFMYFRPQTYTVPKAMEYLEHTVFCILKQRGIKTISRGVDGDNPLTDYKKKMGILQSEKEYTMEIGPRIDPRYLSQSMAMLANSGLRGEFLKNMFEFTAKPFIVIHRGGKKEYMW